MPKKTKQLREQPRTEPPAAANEPDLLARWDAIDYRHIELAKIERESFVLALTGDADAMVMLREVRAEMCALRRQYNQLVDEVSESFV